MTAEATRDRDDVRSSSFLNYGVARLRSICRGLEFDERSEAEAIAVFTRMLHGWGETQIGAAPRWPSDITDDHTPFEFSVAMDGTRIELRLLVEIQASERSLAAYWQAGCSLTRELAAEYGVSLARFEAVENLFAPVEPSAKFAIWHSVALRPGETPQFKVYLNPEARGRAAAENVVCRALERLGFDESVKPYRQRRPLDALKFFSLDLSAAEDARVKIYAAHYGATATEIETVLSAGRHYRPGEIADFCRAMADSEGPYTGLPVQTCLAYTSVLTVPEMGTVHFPIRSYVETDAVARRRIRQYLGELQGARYGRLTQRFAERPLESGVGLQTYASLRQQKGASRVTVYLSPEAYAVVPPRGQGAR